MFYAIWALVIKEILAVWRDKKSRIALIAPPLMQLIILAHAATLEVRNISIGYFNQDAGWYSQELIQRIEGSPYFKEIHRYQSFKQVVDGINNQDVILSLQFPADFSRQIGANKSGTVQLVLDGRKSNASQIVNGYINRIIQDFTSEIYTLRGAPPTIQISSAFRSWFNPNLDYMIYNVPCLIAILSMILSLTVTALSVAREREMGTFDQLLVSPLQPWQILIGKTLPALIIAVSESTLIMILAIFMFNIPFEGSLLLLYLSMVIFITSILGVGLFISSIAKTQQQASLGSFMFMMPTMLLSGYATPIENMPIYLQVISPFLPITHFFVIVKGIFLKDIDFNQIILHILPMMAIGVVTLTCAGWMFGRRLE